MSSIGAQTQFIFCIATQVGSCLSLHIALRSMILFKLSNAPGSCLNAFRLGLNCQSAKLRVSELIICANGYQSIYCGTSVLEMFPIRNSSLHDFAI
uniref:Uncharacterized protein n=1 Tax=Physcomitrium patens TaxID=3218 RepID=A0A7I3ZWN6_PHYPA